jgi:hypothetical protein
MANPPLWPPSLKKYFCLNSKIDGFLMQKKKNLQKICQKHRYFLKIFFKLKNILLN